MEPTPTFPLGAPTSFHLVGYLAGAVVYALLLLTVWQSRHRGARSIGFAIGALGVLWNGGNLLAAAVAASSAGWARPYIDAIAYTALGALPAVAAHSAFRAPDTEFGRRVRLPATAGAYVVAIALGLAHLRQAVLFDFAPSPPGMRYGTVAYGVLAVAVAAATRGQAGWRRALWVVGLGVSSISGLHLARTLRPESWTLELVGHHASPLLALAILYQDYPYALADRFLKRALTLAGLTSVVAVAASVLPERPGGVAFGDPATIGLGLGVLAAACYPRLRWMAEGLVDTFVLRRDSHGRVRRQIADALSASRTVEALLDDTVARLAVALGAADAS